MPALLAQIRSIDESPKAQKLAVLALLGCFLLLSLLSMRRMTLTYDEAAHYQYGLQVLSGNSDRFDDSKMPVSVLNALPGKIASVLPPGALKDALAPVETGRLATLLFSVMVAYFTYRWSRELYGFLPGLFSLFLYTFEPNLIAHSQLVTTDLYAAGMVLLSTYTLWLYSRKRDGRHAALFAVTLGLSQLAKYTCVFLYPLLAVTLLVSDAPSLVRRITGRDWAGLRTSLRQYLVLVVFAFAAGLLVINLGFLFNRTLTPLGNYTFQSDLFRDLQSRLEALRRLPVAVPYPYLQGLDLVRYVERTGENYSRIYLLGHLSDTGFKKYYLVAWLFKTPLAIQAILALAVGGYLWRWISKKPTPPRPPFPRREGGGRCGARFFPFTFRERGGVEYNRGVRYFLP